MINQLDQFLNFLRHAYAFRRNEVAERLVYRPNEGLVASIMDDIFFVSLDDGWLGFTKMAYSFSAMACMAAVVLFLVSGAIGHGSYIDRALSGLLDDPAGLFALYYMEF